MENLVSNNQNNLTMTDWGIQAAEIVALLECGDVERAVLLTTACGATSAKLLNGWARVYLGAGTPHPALKCTQRALELEPDFGAAHFNQARALRSLGRIPEALDSARRSAALQPHHAATWNNLGNLLADCRLGMEADEAWGKALELDPSEGIIWLNRARSMKQVRGLAAALPLYFSALPRLANLPLEFQECVNMLAQNGQTEALIPILESLQKEHSLQYLIPLQLGMAYHRLEQFPKAMIAYQQAVRLNRECHDAFFYAGLIHFLQKPQNSTAAEACFNKVLSMVPLHAEALVRKAQLLEDAKRLKEALVLLSGALDSGLDHPDVIQACMHLEARLCDWSNRSQRTTQLLSAHERNPEALLPQLEMNLLGLNSEQLNKHAKLYARALERRYGMLNLPPFRKKNRTKGRLRVGYLSQDLRNHAVGQLYHGVFKFHDRERVEVFAYSLLETGDAIQKSIQTHVEHYHAVGGLGIRELVERIRGDELDVLVDLGGFTGFARPEVAYHRVAPVQLLHLGYLSTTGAHWYDGVIADETIACKEVVEGFSERLLLMPDSFAVASPLPKSEVVFSRSDFGLPESAFVYCCLSRPLKIDPDSFGLWMQILKEVPEGVLWLFDDGLAECREHLMGAATSCGIEASRLYFAPQLPFERYLASYAVADLFLDTLHYNACATAVGALHAGTPVLSCLGKTFLSRAGGSIARAAGLGELVVETPDEYIRKAVELSAQRDRIASLRATLLSRNSALFDVQNYTQSIEKILFGLTS